ALPIYPLDTVCALFHDAAFTHRDFRIAPGPEFGECLVAILKEVESPGLVGTVIGAESRPHAAVVDLHVQPLRIVHSGTHRANHFAGGMVATRACHGRTGYTPCVAVSV